MSIEVIYSKFKLEEGFDSRQVKELMIRDSSWGTFVPELKAAEKCCGPEALNRWRKTEPLLKNLSSGRFEDERFSLTFPEENFNFQTEGVDHFISTLAGDTLLNPSIKTIEVEDVNFINSELYKHFPGPNIGIDQLYKEFLSESLDGFERPILAFTIKPRLGMNLEDFKKLYINAAESGIDIIEDDERLIDYFNCPFKDRVDIISKIQNNYNSLYSVNITGALNQVFKRLKYAVKKGIKLVKLDVLVTGFETLRQVALYNREKYNSKVAITVYPDAYRAYRHLSRKFILKMSRLCGADIIYAGSPNWARYEKEGGELRHSIEPIYTMHKLLSDEIKEAPHIKPTLPTITNDQHPSRMEIITAFFRKYYNNHYKYAFFVGGGISGFPGDITEAVSKEIECIKHAMTYDLSDYNVYEFKKKIENRFKEIGWDRLNVKEALK